MEILSEDFLEEVEEKKSRIDERRLELLVGQMFSNLIQESIFYASTQEEDNKERKNEVVKNFEKAWKYGKEVYSGEFDLVLLTEIAGRVEPGFVEKGRDYAEFRKESSSLAGMNYLPPADEFRIRADLENVIEVVNNSDLHPVEEAVFLYFHLVRIQPFGNGNKRTATAIMNLTLCSQEFPPIYIKPHEKYTYLTLLGSAIEGFKEQKAISKPNKLHHYTNPNYQQKGFYDFLAKKVLDGLVMAEDKLKRLNKYEITIQTKHPGTLYTAKKKISYWFNRREAVHQVQLNRGSNSIIVAGDISYEVLNCILGKTSRNLKYNISTIEEESSRGPLSIRPLPPSKR